MMFFSATPVVLAAIMCNFFLLALTIFINFTPAPTVVLPDAVVPSRKSALTPFVEFMKSIYLSESGKLLFKALTSQLIQYV